MKKLCRKCHKEKDAGEFYKHKRMKDRLTSNCKECMREVNGAWMAKNKGRRKAYVKKHYAEHKEEILSKQAKKRKENPEKTRARDRKYYHDNIFRGRESVRKSRLRHLEERKEKERLRWHKRKSDPSYLTSRKISKRIHFTLKKVKANTSWTTMVPYSLKDLIKRLKRTMPDGYNWQDFLEGRLHIDHIDPISAFNYEKPEDIDFQRCWALKNLRLLPAQANMMKGGKLLNHVQTSFVF